ncbi:hypothetical protein ACFLW1_02440 [Chloroflexota bacterium]
MEGIELIPEYSTEGIPGKCIKCLAEQELNTCLRELLADDKDNEELQQKYEMLRDFLRAPKSQELRDEAEQCLADGKKVAVEINFSNGKLNYELKVEKYNFGGGI